MEGSRQEEVGTIGPDWDREEIGRQWAVQAGREEQEKLLGERKEQEEAKVRWEEMGKHFARLSATDEGPEKSALLGGQGVPAFFGGLGGHAAEGSPASPPERKEKPMASLYGMERSTPVGTGRRPVGDRRSGSSVPGDRGYMGSPGSHTYGQDFRKEWGAHDRLAKPVYMPGKFDGAGHLTEYLAHFDLCRRANGWNHEQAGVFLGLSLTGVARRLLAGIEPATEGGYLQLREALVARFQPDNQGGTYKAILRNKERAPGECLQSYAEEIERCTRLAYPRADMETVGVMAKDRFIESLKDQQLQYWVYQAMPETLREAVQSALHAEACMQPFKAAPKARAAGTTMAEQMAALGSEVRKDREESAAFRKSVAQASKPSGKQPGRPKSYGTPEEGRCYYCAEKGHFRSECPAWTKLVTDKLAEEGKKTAPATSGN